MAAASLTDQPADRARQPGGGRSPVEKTPATLTALEALVTPETAGDPMSKQKCVRRSLRTLSDRFQDAGHSLHVNSKQLEARSNHPDRDVQFAHIDEQTNLFKAVGQPIISVDSKKLELIGDFKQAGRIWSREPIAVNIHDFFGR